jgi:hypothetical protein
MKGGPSEARNRASNSLVRVARRFVIANALSADAQLSFIFLLPLVSLENLSRGF